MFDIASYFQFRYAVREFLKINLLFRSWYLCQCMNARTYLQLHNYYVLEMKWKSAPMHTCVHQRKHGKEKPLLCNSCCEYRRTASSLPCELSSRSPSLGWGGRVPLFLSPHHPPRRKAAPVSLLSFPLSLSSPLPTGESGT